MKRKHYKIQKGIRKMFSVKFRKNGVEDVVYFTIALFADMWIEEQRNSGEDFELISVRAMPF